MPESSKLTSSEQSLFPIYVSKKVLLRPAAGRTEISQLFYDILVALANVTPTPTWRPPNQRKPGWLTGWVTLGGSARFPWMPLTPSCFPTTLITLFGMQNFPMCFRRQDSCVCPGDGRTVRSTAQGSGPGQLVAPLLSW